MGMDQYFYKRNPNKFDTDEVLYARKNYLLHDIVSNIVTQDDSYFKNGGVYRIEREELDSIIKEYVEQFKMRLPKDYIDEIDEYHDYEINFLGRLIAVLTIFDVLWYSADW